MPLPPISKPLHAAQSRPLGKPAAPDSAPSPLTVALGKQQAQQRRQIKHRGRVLEAELGSAPADSTPPPSAPPSRPLLESIVADIARRPDLARTLRPDTRSLAKAVAPLMPETLQRQTERSLERQWHGLGRFLSGLSQAKVWRWTAEALWEGEAVSEYIDSRVKAAEVVEIVLHDPAGLRVLAAVTLPGVTATKMHATEAELQTAEPEEGAFYVFIGARCRLSARVIGAIQPEAKRFFQALCMELDELLAETVSDAQERIRVLPLKLRSGLSRQGPFTHAYSSRRATAAILLAAGLVLGFFTWIGVSEYRWQRYVELLQKEPGVHVVRYERGWGRSLVVGTVASGARDPAMLAESLGINAGHLDLRFKTMAEPQLAPDSITATNDPVREP
jgi:hypothetical protein